MSFLTGRLPSEIDCLTNERHLSSEIPTFAHAFCAADYDTILCGRMHFNGYDQRHGFLRRIVGDCTQHLGPHAGLTAVLGPEIRGTTGPNARSIRLSGPGSTGYLQYDEAVTQAAVRELESLSSQETGRPFMMTVGFVQPHAPFVAPPEDYDYFDSRISIDDLPAFDAEALHPELRRLRNGANLENPDTAPSPEQQRRARVAYHGMCRFLDRNIGRVLDALNNSPLRENTYVLYISDHGEQLGEHGMWWKHTFYRGSVGIPMILRGPDIGSGAVCEKNVSLMDVGPTLLDLCGVPGIADIRGQSFRCLIDGKAEDWKNVVVSENLWPPTSTCLHRMVASGPWKMNDYPGFDPELFNMDEDPGELRNVVSEPANADTLAGLHRRLEELESPGSVIQRIQTQQAVQPMIDRAFIHGDVPCPDVPWFVDWPGGLQNRIDPR